VERKYAEKINKKEKRKALRSAIAATARADIVAARGHIFEGELPKIVVDEFEGISRSRDMVEVLNAIGVYQDVIKAKNSKRVRAGKGKMRGRRYKNRKSLLIVVKENKNVNLAARNLSGVDVVKVKDLNAELLAPGTHPGRLTIWTEGAIVHLEEWP
jgi:large subunit ribosomal protein L4e